jgi:predicted nucleotidyltransferase
MSSILLDLSGKIDAAHRDALSLIKEIADSLNTPFFIVGASARDYLLEHYYGQSSPRRTLDIDLGVEVAGWEQYERLSAALLASGKFTRGGEKQRLLCGAIMVDIIPFGPIAGEERKISWPPEHEVIMGTQGYQEAYESSVTVRLCEKPELTVKVASLPGLAVMKLISWDERYPERQRDAEDLLFIMEKYGNAGNEERLFTNEQLLMSEENFDILIAGARLLGQDMATMFAHETIEHVRSILEQETEEQSQYHLVTDMLRATRGIEGRFEQILLLVMKLQQGLCETLNKT